MTALETVVFEIVLRIATWNMDHWRRSKERRAEAWTFLRDRVRPDVALLQEASPTERGEGVVYREGGLLDDRVSPAKDRGWGSAVISFGPKLRSVEHARSPFHKRPIPLLRTFPGSVAIAEVTGEDNVVVISAYGVIDRGYADATVHRILSDLEPLIDERHGRGIVIGGDLNITTQWSAQHKGFLRGRHEECLRRDQNLFDRFSSLGFHNLVVRAEPTPLEGCGCVSGPACRHVRTQRHDRSEFPWQNDYVFVTPDLLERAPKVEVLDEEAAWRLSGHCPVVIEI